MYILETDLLTLLDFERAGQLNQLLQNLRLRLVLGRYDLCGPVLVFDDELGLPRVLGVEAAHADWYLRVVELDRRQVLAPEVLRAYALRSHELVQPQLEPAHLAGEPNGACAGRDGVQLGHLALHTARQAVHAEKFH